MDTQNENDTSFNDDENKRCVRSSVFESNNPDFDISKDCPAARGACSQAELIAGSFDDMKKGE